ncbi:MAG: mycothiol conjugate amidase Mca [Actinomycetales bacterium]
MADDLRLMAVHAHPDDESSKGAATMARYVSEGVSVLVVTCTGGERGDVLHSLAEDEVAEHGLAEVRRREMARAAAILGVDHAWLGFEDSGYPQGDPPPDLPEGCFAALPLTQVTEPLVAHIRAFRPHVVTTYDERGGYPHPDHVRCHQVTMAAVDLAEDPLALPDLGPAWSVSKVYYHHQFSRGRLRALHQAMLDAGLSSPYQEWLAEAEAEPDDSHRITTRIHAADWFEVRDAALQAHRTQIDPASTWFAVPRDLQRQVWPTEEFELARSRVVTAVPETDLFSGIR